MNIGNKLTNLNVRMSIEEKKELDDYASFMGMSSSEFVRQAIRIAMKVSSKSLDSILDSNVIQKALNDAFFVAMGKVGKNE